MRLKEYCVILSVLLVLLTSCQTKSRDKSPFISVSIEPQRYFAEKIVGDKFQVKSLVPNGSSPESFDPSPSQMIAFGQSKAYFMLGFFPFEKKWGKSFEENNPSAVLVDCSKSIDRKTLLHDSDGHADFDPHVWNSPKNALVISKEILDGVVSIDPANKVYYEANFKKLSDEISETDSIIRQKLSKLQKRTFIIYHPALSYFAKEYGLEQYSVESEGKSPSPSQMVELVKLAKAKGIKTIFVQPEFDKKNAEVLANEIDGRIVEINPLAYDWKEEMLKIADALENQ